MVIADPLTENIGSEQKRNGKVINDFSILVATPNGSGSQTSNLVLLRALFKMGVPSSGKNLFPSNIQGMPTWYSIRCCQDGYVSWRERAEIAVLMNPATAPDDIAKIQPGGVCLYPESAVNELTRGDLNYYPMPTKQLSKEAPVSASMRPYIANMVYVGVLAHVLGIEITEIEAALRWQFSNRDKLVQLNLSVITAAEEWASQNLTKTDPYVVERSSATEGLMMIDGNSAAALGAIYGGMTVMSWYPITPSTSLADKLSHYAKDLRRSDTGKNTYAIVQAEDELAAIGMVIGAGWAGARAMTATSGPGISLMSEFAGFGYYAEIPAVIWDIQRVGPSTGLPTRVSQGDVTACYWSGHGDTEHVCLLPGNPAECFEFGWRAFDIAERLQTPVFVLSDLDLGMNNWMTTPFDYPEEPLDRGKVLTAKDVSSNGFHRYLDVDDDGIPYRTLPGNEQNGSAYFTRGSGHNADAMYSEDPKDYLENMKRLKKKLNTAQAYLPQPVTVLEHNADIGFIGFGSTDPAITEARDLLAAEGLASSYLRLRALPASTSITNFVNTHNRVYVIELNVDGQLHKVIRLQLPNLNTQLLSLAYCDGQPLTANWITKSVLDKEAEENGTRKQ
ncbi:MAG: 2-oxoacid:acceptor oxidoreductase subunit alpha [Anaerolineales bacterium]|nr:2-oxoacid:acceptor oxidoreductase subunit alpha [Anaerolineales bacterium]